MKLKLRFHGSVLLSVLIWGARSASRPQWTNGTIPGVTNQTRYSSYFLFSPQTMSVLKEVVDKYPCWGLYRKSASISLKMAHVCSMYVRDCVTLVCSQTTFTLFQKNKKRKSLAVDTISHQCYYCSEVMRTQKAWLSFLPGICLCAPDHSSASPLPQSELRTGSIPAPWPLTQLQGTVHSGRIQVSIPYTSPLWVRACSNTLLGGVFLFQPSNSRPAHGSADLDPFKFRWLIPISALQVRLGNTAGNCFVWYDAGKKHFKETSLHCGMKN